MQYVCVYMQVVDYKNRNLICSRQFKITYNKIILLFRYQIADGTHVGEEGYFTDPKATDESIVKKGWYSFTAADGKVYTVTYWADKTGFHAYGDHLPTPPPVPAAIQA